MLTDSVNMEHMKNANVCLNVWTIELLISGHENSSKPLISEDFSNDQLFTFKRLSNN